MLIYKISSLSKFDLLTKTNKLSKCTLNGLSHSHKIRLYYLWKDLMYRVRYRNRTKLQSGFILGHCLPPNFCYMVECILYFWRFISRILITF